MSKKVLVVGNSPSVLQYNYGELIDTFDIVIRCNWYKILGYENHVGTKTSIWAIAIGREFMRIHEKQTSTHFLERDQDPKKMDGLWLRFSKSDRAGAMNYFNKIYGDVKHVEIPNDWYKDCIGLCCCKLALQTWKNSEVWSFGNTFHLEQKNKLGRFHYYDYHLKKSELDIHLPTDSHCMKNNKVDLEKLPIKTLEENAHEIQRKKR